MRATTRWIGPSILTANLLDLGADVRTAEEAGIDFLHLDVMDGRFVPNISFGLPVAEALRKASTLPLDVHLMIVEPEKYALRFVDAGADMVTVQAETCTHLHGTIRAIADAGATAGVALNPGTPLAAIEEVLPFVGYVLVMTVNPGFGGQTFIPTMLDKIERLRERLDRVNPACRIEVDGGIKASNIAHIAEAGADMFVVGSAIYAPGQDIGTAVRALKEGVAQAMD